MLTLSSNATLVYAQSPEEKGLAIATEYNRRDLGYGDYIADMEMVLINSQGETSVRKLRTRTIEVESEGESERRLLMFDQPRDVRGTVLLTASNKHRDDDQWLYFPVIKRVKRISSSSRAGPFMGSEFSYEDFGSPEVEKYTYKYLKDEACGELDCFVFERYPTGKNSGYSKQVLWVDKGTYRLWRINFFDRKSSLLKVLEVSDYQLFSDNYWRAGKMLMSNLQTQKKTRLNWQHYKFSVGLTLSEFQPARLKNVR